MEIGNHIRTLIEQYYHGEIDDESAVELAAWVSGSDEASALFKAELHMLEESDSSVLRSADRINDFHKRQKTARHPKRPAVIAALAVAVLAAILVPVSFFVRQEGQSREITVAPLPDVVNETGIESRETEVPASSLAQTFVAPRTGILPVTLADGTTLILNKCSKLTVDGGFNRKTRTVSLDGEAWFDVVKNEGKPFRVICGKDMFIVRGTTFNISSYSADNFSVVTLHSGSLEALVRDDKLLLDPGDELRIDEEDENISKRKVDISHSTRWMDDGALHFSSLPLKYVAAQIGHKYDVRIRVHSSIANIVYDGDIDNEPLDVALRLLAITAPVKLSVTNLDGEYYITKCNTL